MKSKHITYKQCPALEKQASPQDGVEQKHEDFSQGIAEYLRTRERPKISSPEQALLIFLLKQPEDKETFLKRRQRHHSCMM